MRIFAILLASLLCSAPVQAEILTFNFTGVWNTLRADVDGKSRSVVSSNIIPGGVKIGDSFHGTFNLDTDLVANVTPTYVSYWPAYWQNKEYSGVKNSITLNSETTVATNLFSSHAYVSTNSYFVSIGSNMQSLYMDATFYDPSIPLQGSAIPTDFSADIHTAEMRIHYFVNSDSITLEGMLTSFEKVSPVPEPETYAMFIAGLAMMGAVARKRRQQSAA